MSRVSEYRVYFAEANGERSDIYIQALSAQQAVDFVRTGNEEIIEVSKVVNNWR